MIYFYVYSMYACLIICISPLVESDVSFNFVHVSVTQEISTLRPECSLTSRKRHAVVLNRADLALRLHFQMGFLNSVVNSCLSNEYL